MSSLAKLQSAKSLDDLAAILGYKPAALAYILYHLPTAKKYAAFTIPKRDGKPREILAPTHKLKLLQRRLANVLYLALADIDKAGPPHRQLSHGFAKHLSIVTNANIHRRRRYVLNLDLKDFFPSINFGRVRGIFIKDKRFGLEPKIATLVAQIACHDDVCRKAALARPSSRTLSATFSTFGLSTSPRLRNARIPDMPMILPSPRTPRLSPLTSLPP